MIHHFFFENFPISPKHHGRPNCVLKRGSPWGVCCNCPVFRRRRKKFGDFSHKTPLFFYRKIEDELTAHLFFFNLPGRGAVSEVFTD